VSFVRFSCAASASSDDVLITDGTGMTGVVNKFQRILGLKVSENLKNFITIPAEKKPVLFRTWNTIRIKRLG
jgi:predicted neutral ceramidase superfamily lipid hydrolase